MSRLMMRPPGPEPCSPVMSRPRSEASRRARGEDLTWPPLPVAGAGPLDGGTAGRGRGRGRRRSDGRRSGRRPRRLRLCLLSSRRAVGLSSRRGWSRCGSRLRDHRIDVLVRPCDHRHELADRPRLTFVDEALAQHAGAARDELHDRLVRLHLGEDVAVLHGVAFVLQPFDEAPLFHRGRERLHEDFGCHLAGGQVDRWTG